jgi:Beta-lactamase superfamily domain
VRGLKEAKIEGINESNTASKLCATLPRDMITVSTLKGGACAVNADSVHIDVFPEKPQKDTWTLLAHPEEQLSNQKVVSWPGEYDFGGVTVRGIGQEEGKQVSFTCDTENVCVAFIGAPVLEWTDNDVEKLGEVDVLVIAADQPKKVQEVVESVDPRLVVLFEVAKGDLAGVAKACGLASIEKTKDVKIKASTLPSDTRQVVVLG